MFAKLRATLKRWVVESRRKRAGKIASDAAARGEELRERGKTGSMFP